MLKITIPEQEYWNKKTREFETKPELTLRLEHSLFNISKWEAKWTKPFLSNENKTEEELMDYIKMMSSDEIVEDIAGRLTSENYETITAYLQAPMTATVIRNTGKGGSREIITNELIYHWMINLNIPFECQHWHIKRLLTLIEVCTIKNSPGKKMSKQEVMQRNKAINDARRKKLNTTG